MQCGGVQEVTNLLFLVSTGYVLVDEVPGQVKNMTCESVQFLSFGLSTPRDAGEVSLYL